MKILISFFLFWAISISCFAQAHWADNAGYNWGFSDGLGTLTASNGVFGNLRSTNLILGPTGSASSSTFLRGDWSWATPSGGGTAFTNSSGAVVNPYTNSTIVTFGSQSVGINYGLTGITNNGEETYIKSGAGGNAININGVAFDSSGNVTTSATVTGGGVTSTGTISTGAGGGEAPTAISVGASPFTFTCPSGEDIFVFFVNGTTTITSVTLNGSSITSGGTVITGAFPMRPGDSMVIAYTSFAPTMSYIAR